MPFDPDEFETPPEDAEPQNGSVRRDQAEAATAAVIAQFDEAATAEDVNDASYMLEVEQRLEVASHYHELLRAPLFSHATAASQIVEREHRAFVKERMEILLGIKAAKPQVVHVRAESQFTEEETAAIKILIASMRKKGMLAAETPAPAVAQAPAVRASAPPVARPTPSVVARPAPVVAQRTAPAQSQSSKPVQETAARPAAPVKGKPGRKPNVKVQTVDHPVTGLPYDFAVAAIQRPPGAVPFPTDMSAATEMAATLQTMQSGGPRGGVVDISAIVAERTRQ